MRCDSACAFAESKRQSSTFVAFSENSAKFTPMRSQVAPSGLGRPGQTRIGIGGTVVINHPQTRRDPWQFLSAYNYFLPGQFDAGLVAACSRFMAATTPSSAPKIADPATSTFA